MPVDEIHNKTANEGHDGHAEQQSVVALNCNPKHREMTDNGCAQRTESQDAPAQP